MIIYRAALAFLFLTSILSAADRADLILVNGKIITVDADDRIVQAVAPDTPCFLRHGSGQYAVVNSVALKITGIDGNTPDPHRSKIVHDKNGEPNGILSHGSAENLAARFEPGYGDRHEPIPFDGIARGQPLCFEDGYTSAQDNITGSPEPGK